ncbi:SURF2 Surfeit locus protein 2 [Eggerthellaceae bacterium 24-137]
MADTTGFSHITVSTDDDDDVVIQAGIADSTFEELTDAELGDGPADAGNPGGEEAVAESEPPIADEPPTAEEPRRFAADDGYRETTLDDIEGSPMSTTQKAVIVVALLGIIAFAAWYLFAR